MAETAAGSRSSFGKTYDPGLSWTKIKWKIYHLASVAALLDPLILDKHLDFPDSVLLSYFHPITPNYDQLLYKLLGKRRKEIINYDRRVKRWKRKREIELQRDKEGGSDLRKNGNVSPKKRMQIKFSNFPLRPSQRWVFLFQHTPLKKGLGKIWFSKTNSWYYLPKI